MNLKKLIKKDSGGNGDIYLMPDLRHVRKYLRNTGTKEKTERFKKEQKIIFELNKKGVPNIAKITEIGKDRENNKLYIEMENYDGNFNDLLSITKGDVRKTFKLLLPIIKSLNLLRQLEHPIIHRDIKPENILYRRINNHYEPYLTDFGIAFILDNQERLTESFISIGPRHFMAPEFEIGRVEEITESGDIFSIGKLIWYLINGRDGDYLPYNLWYPKEYNLENRFLNNQDITSANIIIAQCLQINPNERIDYENLIRQIESFLLITNINMNDNEKQKLLEFQYKIQAFQQEANVININLTKVIFEYLIQALEELINSLPGENNFLNQFLLNLSKAESFQQDVNYRSIRKNHPHYLYSETFPKLYIALEYHVPIGTERYGNITLKFSLNSIHKELIVKFYYSDKREILCLYNDTESLLTKDYLRDNILTEVILEYMNSFKF